jgi:hypothetical protein
MKDIMYQNMSLSIDLSKDKKPRLLDRYNRQTETGHLLA